MKDRIKRYFTEKPKTDFWKAAFITLFLFQYVMPMTLSIMVPLQIGLLSPESQIDYQPIADKIANNLVSSLEKLGNTGRAIATKNPLMGKILFYTISHFVWVIWFSIILLILQMSRYFISWFIGRKR